MTTSYTAQKIWGIAIIAAIIAFGIGRLTGGSRSPTTEQANGAKKSAKSQLWTCSMHPAIKMKEPGKCPICGMTLIPLKAGGGAELGLRQYSMSEAAMKLAEIETQPLERKFVETEISLVGKISYDETRVKTIAAWVPGRLVRLFVDFTGIRVERGDHLVEVYSPELFAAQEELLQALKVVISLRNSNSNTIRKTALATVEASREKLRLLGLSRKQTEALEKRGTPSAVMTITSTIGGVVIHKNAREGMYVKEGTIIYTVADLSTLWVNLDAYESDLPWLRYGQKVDMRTETYGDEPFHGTISFIDPVLNAKTRTVRVRVVVDNAEGLLRPNMFVRATVKARVGKGGALLSANFAGKWICPMHPEVVADRPGRCSVCQMLLESAEKLGFHSNKKIEKPLVVPSSAVLITGKRAVVYVRVPGKKRPTFEGVEIALGPRAGNSYIVYSGLREGQDVVVNGSFKIDSALQLLAKPSMMSASVKKLEPKKLTASPAFLQALRPVYGAYIKAQLALADDQFKTAKTEFGTLKRAVVSIDAKTLGGASGKRWGELRGQIKKALEHLRHATDIAGLRGLFSKASISIVMLEKTFGHAGTDEHVIVYCAMKKAEWLQVGSAVKNPFYGKKMQKCGNIRKRIPGANAANKNPKVAPREDSRMPAPMAFRMGLAAVMKQYFVIQNALVKDHAKGAGQAADAVVKLLLTVKADDLSAANKTAWGKYAGAIRQAAEAIREGKSLSAKRIAFSSLSNTLEAATKRYGSLPKLTVRKVFCPMALNGKGSFWLQEGTIIANPYMGKKMPTCGLIKETISPLGKPEGHNHDRK